MSSPPEGPTVCCDSVFFFLEQCLFAALLLSCSFPWCVVFSGTVFLLPVSSGFELTFMTSLLPTGMMQGPPELLGPNAPPGAAEILIPAYPQGPMYGYPRYPKKFQVQHQLS